MKIKKEEDHKYMLFVHYSCWGLATDYLLCSDWKGGVHWLKPVSKHTNQSLLIWGTNLQMKWKQYIASAEMGILEPQNIAENQNTFDLRKLCRDGIMISNGYITLSINQMILTGWQLKNVWCDYNIYSLIWRYSFMPDS